MQVAAPSMVVYDLVRQLERMGEWSPENRGDVEWTFGVTVNAAEAGEFFAFHTGPADQPLV